MNAPSLRFTEFKEPWTCKRINDIAIKVGSGSTPLGGEAAYVSSGIPFIRSQNIYANQLNMGDVRFIPDAINLKMSGTIVKPRDILLNITGASIGRTCVVPDDFGVANVNQHVCIIRLNHFENPNFFQSYLASDRGQKMIMSTQVGGGREGLNFQAIRAFAIYAPALDEQKKIASFLLEVEKKISLLSKKYELIHQYKKGVSQKIFGQKLRFKDENGGEYRNWEALPLAKIANFIKDGTHGTHIDSDDGEHYLLSAKNINGGKIHFDKTDRRISESEFNSIYKNYSLKNGDILLSVVGTIGRVAIYSDEFRKIAFQRSVAFFRFPDQSSTFMAQLFSSSQFQRLLLKNQVVSAQPGIYLGDLAKIEVRIPCIEEQNKISKFLSGIDKKIDMVRLQLEYTQQYRQGLLQKMFI
jgi:type I restriction enzyme S subunit